MNDVTIESHINALHDVVHVRAGLQGVVEPGDEHYSTFKSHFAALVTANMHLKEDNGKTMLRLRCPQSGLLQVNGQTAMLLPSDTQVSA
jgi:hypothetical protein